MLPYLNDARIHVNTACVGLEAWQIILFTLGATLILMSLYNYIFDEEKSLKQRITKGFFKFVKGLPIIKGKIAVEVAKNAKGIEDGFNKGVGKLPYVQRLPQKGLNRDQIRKELEKYQSLVKIDWSKGLVSGAVYNGAPELTKILAETYEQFAWSNPLHPELWPDVRKMEAEVVRMCCTIFNGDENTCGSVTSGGTESILLACRTYRNRAMERGIRFPEMIVPISVHAAFDKAAEYFRMRITHIPTDPVTCKVNIGKMRRAINKNTCLLVGSAPGFPHGCIDSLEEIAALGRKYDIPVHTDCCLGGFLVPFMEKAGFSVPKTDFRVPGITSISADTHKYGFAPKGSSVLLYSNREYRKYQWFVQPDWPGGIYATPTMSGSRSGAVIAACWAAMMHFGESGYVETTKKIVGVTRYILAELRKIPELEIIGDSQVSVVAIGSKKFNIFRLSDALAELGWSLNPLQFPSSIHFCCTLLHTKPGVADKFIHDVKAIVKELVSDPNAHTGGMGAIYGMSQSIPDRSLVSEICGLFLDACYMTKDPVTENGDTPNGTPSHHNHI